MAKYRAIAKGYYGDVIHDPETDHHVISEGPDDLEGSWFVKVDDDTPVQALPEVSKETEKAEDILDTEADAAKEDVGAEVDVNEEAGVETL